MGMFTSVYVPSVDTPSGELEVQFKCGWDSCDVYRIGDRVDFRVLDTPGHVCLADGVYEGVSSIGQYPNERFSYWCVVIKDHIIKEVKAFVPDRGEYLGDQLEALRIYYELPIADQYPREWWSEEAWQKKEQRDREAEARHKAQVEKYCKKRGLDPDNISAGDCMNLFMLARMEEDGFMHRILPPLPVKNDDV